jgi:N5-(cytidine 5'-diphosphoramidyl)-L-glutamine hydrolase
MRVALSLRVLRAQTYEEVRDAISHDWIIWLEKRGHTPLLVPNALERPAEYLREMGAGLLILTGGNDSVQGQAPSSDFEPVRTESEFRMLEFASDVKMPVLGVCRGMHVVNQFFNGQVRPDLPANSLGHVARMHPVRVSGPIGNDLGATQIQTNSFHNQSVLQGDLGDGLTSFAVCEEDNVIEGFAHENLPILGVQWHPERDNPAADIDDLLVSRLAEEGPFWAMS